jgi:SAM-dependent methyltransferase
MLRAFSTHLRERLRHPIARYPHFVVEYSSFVRNLIGTHAIDEAMSLAVGGNYDQIGEIEVKVLQACGLQGEDFVVDFGCGSGRLATQLGLTLPDISYLGIDVVQGFLDYAKSKTPPHFRFVLNHSLGIPCADETAEFVCAFSVFTHLFHEESYSYLADMKRVLKPQGRVVFSFLESKRHWEVFEEMLSAAGSGRRGQLNMFIERPQIEVWAAKLGMELEGFDPGPSLGQTVAVLRKG